MIFGKMVLAIINGGASCSIVNNEFVPVILIKLNDDFILIHLANGQLTKALGVLTRAVISLGDEQLPLPLVCLPRPGYDLLLGRDFLERTQCATDWVERTYKFNFKGQKIRDELPIGYPEPSNSL